MRMTINPLRVDLFIMISFCFVIRVLLSSETELLSR
jgi:hypothetical protein